MYGPEVIALFGAYKDVWDPAGGMNPGMLVRPARLDENLRFAVLPPGGGELSHGVARCVGVAKCRTTEVGGPGVMCPSYRATGEELHSTRGRARLLHEMLAGEVVTDGWRSREVAEALDLCLSCKGCRSDCPVGGGHGRVQGGVPAPPLVGPDPPAGPLPVGRPAAAAPHGRAAAGGGPAERRRPPPPAPRA
ncbi:hypothetical protein GCM10020254_47840 [Streptomyces goshikiensis]